MSDFDKKIEQNCEDLKKAMEHMETQIIAQMADDVEINKYGSLDDISEVEYTITITGSEFNAFIDGCGRYRYLTEEYLKEKKRQEKEI